MTNLNFFATKQNLLKQVGMSALVGWRKLLAKLANGQCYVRIDMMTQDQQQ
jgi:hypothetical protein